MKRTGPLIELTEPYEIFVFGSNLAGRHGGGAARFALDNYGAKWGDPEGFQGRSYAIPTKDERIETLPLSRIQAYVDLFLVIAENRPDVTMILTPIGCGLAGYTPADIAPMFTDAPKNVILPEEFLGVFTGRRSSV